MCRLYWQIAWVQIPVLLFITSQEMTQPLVPQFFDLYNGESCENIISQF